MEFVDTSYNSAYNFEESVGNNLWEKLDCTEGTVTAVKGYKHNEINVSIGNENTTVVKEFIYNLIFSDELFQTYREVVNPQMTFKIKQKKRRKLKIKNQNVNRFTTEVVENIDQFTMSVINKMIHQKCLKIPDGTVSVFGKESIILHAEVNSNYEFSTEDFPKELAIKIFKRVLVKYHQPKCAYLFIHDDRWHKSTLTRLPRKSVNTFAEKEMMNLTKLQKCGIYCPKPIILKNHILVMSFIGENGKAAKRLKDMKLNTEDYVLAYEEVMEAMKTMYQITHLVHTDLLNNILWYKRHCCFIGLGQVIETTQEESEELIMRNCELVTEFFFKRRVSDLYTPFKLFEYITGYDPNYKLDKEIPN